MIDFYAHLESDACVQEFPHNSQYSFKDRLPYPISMKERGWKSRQRDLWITKESIGRWMLTFYISAYLPIKNLPI